MADLEYRLPSNVAGDFYVTSECIDCDMCRNTAPEVFGRDEESGFSFVHRQPSSPDELERATEAMDHCPTECIGSNGGIGTSTH